MTDYPSPRAVMPELHALITGAVYRVAPCCLPAAALAHTDQAHWRHAADAVADAIVTAHLRDQDVRQWTAPVDGSDKR